LPVASGEIVGAAFIRGSSELAVVGDLGGYACARGRERSPTMRILAARRGVPDYT
jgi:hypothetical protein